MTWMDKRPVKVLSTCHTTDTNIITRRRKNRGGNPFEQISKPQAVIDYNKYMGGVDKIGQMLSYYPTVRRTIKWPKKLFFWLVELVIHNSLIILNHNLTSRKQKKMNLLEFQLKLIDSLCTEGLYADEDGAEDLENEVMRERRERRAPKDSLDRLVGGYKEVCISGRDR